MKKQDLINLCNEMMKELDDYDLNYKGIVICQKHAVMCQKTRIRRELEKETLITINILKQLKELNLLKKRDKQGVNT